MAKTFTDQHHPTNYELIEVKLSVGLKKHKISMENMKKC